MKHALFSRPGRPSRPNRQAGASLIVVLLLLVIVSILGAGAAQIATMGERSARNDRDMQVAWQSAEAALKYLVLGGTDSRFFRHRDVPAYGFFPVLLSKQYTASVHGVDERIPVAALGDAVRVIYEALRKL